jgi:4-amino-4-deoxy-L-arabinose transferase-like glycosyltransferase
VRDQVAPDPRPTVGDGASLAGGPAHIGSASRLRRRSLLVPAAVVLLALILRLGAIAGDGGYRPANDALEYDYLARSIGAGDGYPPSGYLLQGGPTAFRGPAYPFLLGAVYAVSGDNITAGRVLGALLGAIVVGLLYLIAKRIWGCRVALVAATMAALFPPLVLLSRDLLSESLLIVLELGAILCVLEFRRSGRQLRWAAGAGLACGLAILTRPNGFMLAIAIAIGLWTLRPRLRIASLTAPLLFLACAIATITPWVIRDAVEFGRLVPVTTSGGIAAAGAYNEASRRDPAAPGAWRDPQAIVRFQPLFTTPGIDEASVDVVLRKAAHDFAWEHPAYVAEATAWNLLRLFEIAGGSVVDRHGVAINDRGIGSADPLAERIGLALVCAFAAIGAFTLLGPWADGGRGLPRAPRGPLFLWLVPILMLVVTLPLAGLPRYRLPLDPFLLILAAVGLLALWDRRPGVRPLLTGGGSA